ncbi:MAG: tail fiber domain-containing protein [Bacteroidales bacterium]|nr:tail fiber domain-containing protein [Bacteroidales bacterium]
MTHKILNIGGAILCLLFFNKGVADKQPHFGFVAQEVEQTHPELVKTMHDGTKALAYNEFIAILLEG